MHEASWYLHIHVHVYSVIETRQRKATTPKDNSSFSQERRAASGQTRIHDVLRTRQTLYQLNHAGQAEYLNVFQGQRHLFPEKQGNSFSVLWSGPMYMLSTYRHWTAHNVGQRRVIPWILFGCLLASSFSLRQLNSQLLAFHERQPVFHFVCINFRSNMPQSWDNMPSPNLHKGIMLPLHIIPTI